MGVKPRNVEIDSWAYTLPHEIGFLIEELAKQEGVKLGLSRLSTSKYIERLVRKQAEEMLPSEVRKRAQERAQARTQERRQRAAIRKEQAEQDEQLP